MKNLILALCLLSSLPALARENVINNVETSQRHCLNLILGHQRSLGLIKETSRQGGWVLKDRQTRQVVGEASYQPSSRRCNLVIY